jgi:HEPN domain-containing protein
MRLEEARCLFNSGLYSGAYYLAGYAVECALKSAIAKETRQFDFPDLVRARSSFTHNLTDLFKVAELFGQLQNELQQNRRLEASWSVVKDWSEQSRYEFWSEGEANAMIDAVGTPQTGVLPWVERYW